MKPSNRMVLAEAKVLTLPMRRKQYRVWDGGKGRGADPVARGLYVLVSPAGAKSYRSTFYFPGSPKAHTRHLGRVGELSLEEARRQCREDRGKARRGVDPRTSAGGGGGFGAAVQDYVKREQVGVKGNVSASGVERMLLRECSEWLMRPVASITGREIQALLETTRERAPYVANLLHARLQTFFTWCARPGIGVVPTSPMTGIGKPFGGEKRRQRDWFRGDKADAVVKKLWSAKLDPVELAYLKILIITGKRKSALANMQWTEIDVNQKGDWFWNAPEGARNKRLHGVPLPTLAQRIIGKRKNAGPVFPGLQAKSRDFDRRIKQAAGTEDFFLHGVRHLAETKLAELKVPPHIRDVLFDHMPKRGSGAGYDHHEYRDEMLAALELWAGHIERLVQPEGVALLR
jgi:integrase